MPMSQEWRVSLVADCSTDCACLDGVYTSGVVVGPPDVVRRTRLTFQEIEEGAEALEF